MGDYLIASIYIGPRQLDPARIEDAVCEAVGVRDFFAMANGEEWDDGLSDHAREYLASRALSEDDVPMFKRSTEELRELATKLVRIWNKGWDKGEAWDLWLRPMPADYSRVIFVAGGSPVAGMIPQGPAFQTLRQASYFRMLPVFGID